MDMKKKADLPETLLGAVRYFSNQTRGRSIL